MPSRSPLRLLEKAIGNDEERVGARREREGEGAALIRHGGRPDVWPSATAVTRASGIGAWLGSRTRPSSDKSRRGVCARRERE